jgi:hypothetical protein
MTTTPKQTETDSVRLVRVRPVAGAVVRNEITRALIESETSVVYTRAIERRIQAGDLELVGEAEPIEVQQQPQPEPQPYVTEDTRLTGEERRAIDTEITRAEKRRQKETDR